MEAAESMLITEDGSEVRTVWHKKDYNTWTRRLSKFELDSIQEALNNYIDYPDQPNNLLDSILDGKRRIITSSWVPGNNWTGTPFQAIYEKACNYNEESAAKCFGLILQEIIIKRPETWMFGRYKMSDDRPIKGMTYFIVKI